MPTFLHNSKTYQNPVEFALDFIGGKWKMPILWRLRDGPMRYGELRASTADITTKMLTQQLRELERDGYVTRTVFPVVPPHVEYALTERGKASIPVIDTLRTYGLMLMKELGIGN